MRNCKRKALVLVLMLTLIFGAFALHVAASENKTVTGVDITVTGYKIGNKISDVALTINTPGVVFATQGECVNYVFQASDSLGAEWLDGNTEIVSGQDYYITMVLDIDSTNGYTRNYDSDDLTVTANGVSLTQASGGHANIAGNDGASKMLIRFKLHDLPLKRNIEIDSLDTGSVSAWCDDQEVDSVLPGKQVTLRLTQPDDPEKAIRSVNVVTAGDTPVASKYYSDTTGDVTFTMPDEDVHVSLEYGTAITHFNIDIGNFSVGKMLSDLTYTAVDEPNLTVTLKEAIFVNLESGGGGELDASTPFAANTMYMFTLYVNADDGYALRPELYSDMLWNITVNGMSVMCDNVSADGISFDGEFKITAVLFPENDDLDVPLSAATELNGFYELGSISGVTLDVNDPYSVGEENACTIFYNGIPIGNNGMFVGGNGYDIAVQYGISLNTLMSYDFSKLEADMFELGGELASYITFAITENGIDIMAYYEMPNLPIEAFPETGEHLVTFLNPFGQTEYATVVSGGTVTPPEVEYYGFRHVWYNAVTGEKAEFSVPITEETIFEAVWYYDDIVIELGGYEIGGSFSDITVGTDHPYYDNYIFPEDVYEEEGLTSPYGLSYFLVKDEFVDRATLADAMAIFGAYPMTEWRAEVPYDDIEVAIVNMMMNASMQGTLQAGETYWLFIMADETNTAFITGLNKYLVNEYFWNSEMLGVSVDGVPVTDVLTSIIGDAAVMMLKLEPLALPTYQVSIPTGTGFAVEVATGSSSTVTEGGDFSFTVSIPTGYMKGAGFTVKVNGTPLTDVNGVYTITNVTENMYITVEGVEIDPTALTTPAPENDGLSGGAIAGIVVGSTAAAGVGGFSAVWFGVQKKTFGDLKNTFKKLGRKIAKKLAKKAKKAKHSDTPETAEIPEIPETPDNEG